MPSRISMWHRPISPQLPLLLWKADPPVYCDHDFSRSLSWNRLRVDMLKDVIEGTCQC